jgi:multidrug efflux pump
VNPIATTLLTVAVLLAGAVAYTQLPIFALPQVDYPTILIPTFYPGASPEVMASSVTSPLERQFGQLPGRLDARHLCGVSENVIQMTFLLAGAQSLAWTLPSSI